MMDDLVALRDRFIIRRWSLNGRGLFSPDVRRKIGIGREVWGGVDGQKIVGRRSSGEERREVRDVSICGNQGHWSFILLLVFRIYLALVVAVNSVVDLRMF
uniref:Uncharacterized protein n=1 Tax=Setaria digitata TaxID=48799 RepID=A0A915Q6Y5_9BILA